MCVLGDHVLVLYKLSSIFEMRDTKTCEQELEQRINEQTV